jgi:hypothetical protein
VEKAAAGPTRLTSVGRTATGDLRVGYSLGEVAFSDARLDVYSMHGTRIAVQRLAPRVGEAAAMVALARPAGTLIVQIRTSTGVVAAMATHPVR